MPELRSIINENRSYWMQRASSYSDVNKVELGGISRNMWLNAIHGQIASHFDNVSPENIRVLDIGTGPGFFAIILAELGYDVTAIDLTPNMLLEAKQNAGKLADIIDFREMNAEALEFADDTFDVIVTRNLTWNLPHPNKAYCEWHRVLREGGLLLNFDSNWYRYLYSSTARAGYESDRDRSASLGIKDQNIGENFDVMEDIARRIPLSRISRPEWDIDVLTSIGMHVTVDENIWQTVWTPEEQINFASTPMFMIRAIKPFRT